MKAEPDWKETPGAGAPAADSPGEQSGIFGMGKMLRVMKSTNLLRLFRFTTLGICTLLFLFFPDGFLLYTQLALILLLLVVSALLVFLYERFCEQSKITSVLIFLEILGISLLLTFTGGFSSPFLWYALNPFIVSALFFTFNVAWLLLGIMLTGTVAIKSYFRFLEGGLVGIAITSYHPLINLIVMAVLIHLFAQLHLAMSERIMEKYSQQKELLTTRESLFASHLVFKGLSSFQKEAASYSNHKDIYSALVKTLIGIFPFRQAAILTPGGSGPPAPGSDNFTFQVIGSGGEKTEADAALILAELEDRWEELVDPRGKQLLISENRRWIARPLHGKNGAVTALFVGWIRKETNPLSFSENLSLFIRFAEQTAEWISVFKQKERVLQHISAVYESIETVSSQSDPHVVIDLFASYARALTDSDKTIFWMVNAGDWESDDSYPIYAVKGQRDVFPEEEWRVPLLQVWSQLTVNRQPVTTTLESTSNGRALLISVPVVSGSNCLGMLACVQSGSSFSTEEIIQILSVLADLSAIAVVRTRAEKFAEKLVVVEEQKRIASEIHDTISQNLFSIVYSIDALAKEAGRALSEIQRETLHDVKNLSADTARELRALIYRLNPRQEANAAFIEEICGYLDKMARMNEVEINHSVEGSAEYLNPAICKNLHRIIKESTANALRHSGCTEIAVRLDISPFRSLLTVADNGVGFDAQNSPDIYTSGNRLGIINMRELALALQGTLTIDSTPGRGTKVTCSIPTTPVSVE